ncbi:MAG: efflux RND transporter periplasmic adaptor subunit [Dongiaceae bacterium]
MRMFIAFAIIAGLAALAWAYVGGAPRDGAASYRFAAVERADLAVFTIATGRIEAIDVVEVSSQLSGQVAELFADFNDEVEAGASLARLDDKTYEAAVAEAEARLAQAEAAHESAVATTEGAVARYEEARLEDRRKQELKAKGNISARDTDKAQADMLTAKSELNAARAEEAVQKAAIDMAGAALRKARIDLDRTIIRAPIDGVVIRRSVELGQTVAASLEAPKLFTIAHDLREMWVHARVDEADIGQIRVGQNARFSVDAYPDRSFTGRVIEIRRAPEIVQNVVTYTVVITMENPDLALLPGMTALVRIATTERPNALLVPNAALRFEPATGASPPTGAADSAGASARVWARTGSGGLSPVATGIGASDGSMTEVLAGSLAEGQEVAIGESTVRSERTLFGLRLGF